MRSTVLWRKRFFSVGLILLLMLLIAGCGKGGNDAPFFYLPTSITSASNTIFTEDTASTFTVTATGLPTITFAITGTLPAGITFNAATGVLSGTPALGTSGTYPLTITASNGFFQPTQNFTLIVIKATVTLSNFQNASVVIGQPDFVSMAINQGGAAGANTIYRPYGNPLFHNGILYIPDFLNHRVLGFNGVPTSNNANADFVLGQPDLTTTLPNSGANQMYGPQTVKVYNGKLFVTEYNNRRVLIWNSAPTTTAQPADVVVGQTGFGLSVTDCTQTSLGGPESMEVAGGKLIVADSDNNRVLIWNTIPTTNGAPADVVLGQGDFTHNMYNDDNQDGVADAAPTARTLRYPSGIWSDGTRLIVADPGNNRILIWNTFPTSNFAPADVVLGQGDFTHNMYNDDNQDGTADAAPTARTLNYPYMLDSNGTQLFVTDFNNNRVLIWNSIPTTNFAPANGVLGQGDFTHNVNNDDNQDGISDGAPTARTLSYPAGIYVFGKTLIVTDTTNNRYLIYRQP
ncbi:MAG: putative Ig domain-containing protein [Smithellaceae bacterium]